MVEFHLFKVVDAFAVITKFEVTFKVPLCVPTKKLASPVLILPETAGSPWSKFGVDVLELDLLNNILKIDI
jgi:hypothetical protein